VIFAGVYAALLRPCRYPGSGRLVRTPTHHRSSFDSQSRTIRRSSLQQNQLRAGNALYRSRDDLQQRQCRGGRS
jgi:hypothetical protein